MAKKIIRVASTDINASLSLQRALLKIKGISFSFANAIIKNLKFEPNKKLGEFSNEEIKSIENAIKNPQKFGIPIMMLNRRKDPENGENLHLSGNSIITQLRMDIDNLRRIRSYRGIRHERGLPVRGQRTKSSFRKNKVSKVGRKRR